MHERQQSFWSELELPRFAPLDRDLTADAVVIGAGLAGVSAARLLKQAGLRVALLERGRVGGVDTGNTTAHLTAVTDERLSGLVSRFGRHHAQAAWDAGLAAIHQIENTVAELDIDCDFVRVPGYLHAPIDSPEDVWSREAGELRDEARLAAELGYDATFLEAVPLVNRPGMRIDHQAKFHPRKYLRRLLQDVHGDGSAVFEQTDARIADEPHLVRCGPHSIRTLHVVVATHNPRVGRQSWLGAQLFQTRLSLYTSYVVRVRLNQPIIPESLYWDTSDPYRYLRVDRAGDERFVIAGGEDHKTGQEPDERSAFWRLEHWVSALLPTAQVTHRWSGQVIETVDGLPFIGEVAKGQYVMTGFAGNGMTFGTVGAMMARDAITGRTSPWSDLFDTGRTAVLRGPLDYARENADYPYYMVRDRFAGVSSRPLRAIAPGEGHVVEVNGQVVAAARDDQGRLSVRSAICTHMGCRVAWNQAEHTWDCPCHGSRFAASGEVLSGPAERPLAGVQLPVAPERAAGGATMSSSSTRPDGSVKGLVAGAVAGLVAAWAMAQFQNGPGSLQTAAQFPGHEPDMADDREQQDRGSSGDDETATMKAADTLSRQLRHQPLTHEQKQEAAPLVHYAFGMAMGAVYGGLAEALPAATRGAGIPFGLAVWLGADEIGVPAAGLSDPLAEIPASSQAYALASHVVYGASLEAVRRVVRKALR